ncbi:manganese catalase family protein [Bacillus licheniformis]|nr:manganese catalase family protein [Bacillus licheniformis]
MDTGAEELAHIEMLATMIARLWTVRRSVILKSGKDPVIGAILGGMNPQHAIVSGLGAMPADSVGNRWTADYIIASGNLLADFRANLNAESQGRLQAVRLYEETTDRGVKDMLSWLIARDTMHQTSGLQPSKNWKRKKCRRPKYVSAQSGKREVSHVLFNFQEATRALQADGRRDRAWMEKAFSVC